MLGLSVVPALVQFIGFFFLPESPRWLLQKGRIQEAHQVLSRIRGGQNIDTEFETIKTSIEEEGKEAGGGERFQKIIAMTKNKQTSCLYYIKYTFWFACSFGGLVILRILRHGPTRRALIVGCGLQMFQQLSGINTVM